MTLSLWSGRVSPVVLELSFLILSGLGHIVYPPLRKKYRICLVISSTPSPNLNSQSNSYEFSYLLILLIFVVLSLCCCAWAYSYGEQRLLFVAVHELLIVVVSLVGEHRLEVVCEAPGFSSFGSWALVLAQ